MKHYVRIVKSGKIHTFNKKSAALKFHRNYNKKHGAFTSDYGNDNDGFPEAHLHVKLKSGKTVHYKKYDYDKHGPLKVEESDNYMKKNPDKNAAKKIGDLWKLIADNLNLSQYKETMGISNYRKKAEAAKKVSKSKKVHEWANELISLYDSLYGSEKTKGPKRCTSCNVVLANEDVDTCDVCFAETESAKKCGQKDRDKVTEIVAACGPGFVLEVVADYIRDSLKKFSSLKSNEIKRAKTAYIDDFIRYLK